MREVGAVLEARAFHPARSARGHLRMLAAAGHSRSCPGGRVPDRQVDAVLELVGLAPVADRPAGGFSLGMAQRLGLAHRHRLRLHELATHTASLEAAFLELTRGDVEYAAGGRP